MLNAQESKMVLSTLTQRRAWLKKTLDENKIDADQRKEHTQSLNTLESAMKKLAALVSSSAEKTAVPIKPSASPVRKSVTLENARVLVADDDNESATLLCGLLEDMGIRTIDHATDGRDAFDHIKSAESAYDIILCDWDMPELSGMEVYKKAKASNTLRGAHFCMVTGVSEATKIREAIQGGVNDYIVKPVDGEILLGKINANFATRNQEEESD